MESNVYSELEWRGLFYQQSNPEAIRALLGSGTQTVYAGFDPTAESLHVGHLVPLIALRRFQLAGHCPIALVGGATGLIGDPSGKASERTLNELQTVQQWSDQIKKQLEKIVDFTSGKYQAKLLNNYSWIGTLSTIEFLREYGKHFTVNWMMAKDSVSTRIESETGISYTEFSYMILQAYDFYYLAKNHGCRLQIGGSDQWGNMTAGIELIRRKMGAEAHASTFPLLTTSSGKKFGKTEAGAIWLDPNKTSPYDFYQFWIKSEDRDVINYLKYFTLVSRSEIEELAQTVATSPEKRLAQKKLAYELTKMVHSEEDVNKVVKTSEALFGKGDFHDVDAKTLENILNSTSSDLTSAPSSLEISSESNVPDILELATKVGLCSSKTDAKKTISSGGLYINNQRVDAIEYRPSISDFISGKFLVLRKGKKNYAIIRLKQ